MEAGSSPTRIKAIDSGGEPSGRAATLLVISFKIRFAVALPSINCMREAELKLIRKQ